MMRETLPPAERARYNEALGATTRELNSMAGTAFGPLDGPGHLLAHPLHHHGRRHPR